MNGVGPPRYAQRCGLEADRFCATQIVPQVRGRGPRGGYAVPGAGIPAHQEIGLDKRHVTRHSPWVIKTFADRHTEELFRTGRSRRLPPDIARRARRRLEYIDLATQLDDLRIPPGNRLHWLRGDREGQHAIAVNDQWRICFRFDEGDAYDVEVTDYH